MGANGGLQRIINHANEDAMNTNLTETAATAYAALDAADAEVYANKRAETAYDAFIASLPLAHRDDIDCSAMANSFAVEVYYEYANDFARWTAAISTARDCAENLGLLNFA
jgi:hypothetical protein